MNDSFYVKIGVSDNNEWNKTCFCVRTYVEGTPAKKILAEDFDDAWEKATVLVGGDTNKIDVNVRAQRRAKHLILEERRSKRNEQQTAPESLTR
jgi:hypothetical protein